MTRDDYIGTTRAPEAQAWINARWPDVAPALVQGKAAARAGTPAVMTGLLWWADLAGWGPSGQPFDKPEALDLDSVEAWARRTIESAANAETNPPRAGYTRKARTLTLWWEGTWTDGRTVEFAIWEDGTMDVRWDTATGEVSAFLQPEATLCADGWGEPEVCEWAAGPRSMQDPCDW